MKRFIRTVAGKTINFIICVVAVCIFCASVGAACLMLADDGFNFYTMDERSLKAKVAENEINDAAFQAVWQAANGEKIKIDNDNIECEIVSDKGKVLYKSNQSELEDDSWDASLTLGAVKKDGEVSYIFKQYRSSEDNDGAEYYTINVRYYGRSLESDLISALYKIRYSIYIIGFVFLLIAIITFVELICAAGRRPDTDEVVPGPLGKVPFDVLLVVTVVIVIAGMVLCIEAFEVTNRYLAPVILAGLIFVFCTILPLGLSMSFATRVKMHTLIKKTLIYIILSWIWRVIKFVGRQIRKLFKRWAEIGRNMPIIWKTVLCVFGISFVELIFVMIAENGALFIFFMLEKIIFIPFVFYFVISLKKLQKGGEALAAGDLSYVTDTNGMVWDLKKHGENLNGIAKGMAIAVSERTKSERMKAELITNVSHDIKTPLTSIINYASLIGNEKSDNEKITEYSDVLVRQSGRLKRLLEDLVEASKASTGNLDVTLSPCDVSVFLNQADGEYEEKLRKADLTLVTKMPENELYIMADGRRMWRIFDNLMNNICKYAQPGTRVYLLLEQVGNEAVISFKNTSRDALDMNEAELMERFTRGDSSRNTEGSGLGLSIARSMAELQGGSLSLVIDGDLFKAVLKFPLV